MIVRVNDRGPFKHNREIDLSYAAAYKLRFISKGSTWYKLRLLIRAIDPNAIVAATHKLQKPRL